MKTDEIKNKGLQEISTDGSQSDHGDELVSIAGRRAGRAPGEHPPATVVVVPPESVNTLF